MIMIKEPILKLLGRIYEPDAMIELMFGRYDLAIKTDGKGRAKLLFPGSKDQHTGKIKGARFAIRLIENENAEVLKDHWENKGKATAQL